MASRRMRPEIAVRNDDFEGLCMYCGMPHEELDHVYAKAVHPSKIINGKSWRTGPLVECCGDCNRTLSDRKGLDTPQLRAQFLSIKFIERLQDLEKVPDWENDEIEEFGRMLRSCVEHSVNEKHLLRSRIKWSMMVMEQKWYRV